MKTAFFEIGYLASQKLALLRNLVFITFLLLSHFNIFGQSLKPEATIIINVSLIDGTGTPPLKNMAVLFEDGRFTQILETEKVSIPNGTKIIDGKGKTMIPGIVGVHNHLHIPGNPFIGEIATKLYLASGVTTIQTCGAASPNKELELAENIRNGQEIGPDIIPSGPYITGDKGNPNMIIPENESQLRDTIDFWAGKGAKWFKVYRNTKTEDLKIIIDQAHKNGAKVTGHLCSITFKDATELGIDAIEHGFNSLSDFRSGKKYNECGGDRDYIDSLSLEDNDLDQLLNLMVKNKVVLTSTLSIYEASISSRYSASIRGLDIMSDDFKNEHNIGKHRINIKNPDRQRENRLKRIMDFEYRFFRKGGILSAGVDAGRYVLPGFGDQRNYQLFIEAGFTPSEAVMIMTRNGALKLEIDEIGSIEVGKKANFLLLDGDLENDPQIIEKVLAVYKDGKFYDPEAILKGIKGKYPLN